MNRVRNVPLYCPYCGHRRADNSPSEAIITCPVCQRIYWLHPFRDDDFRNVYEESWYDIPSFEGLYQVSSRLRVRSLERKGPDGRSVAGKMLSTYHKGKQIYISLHKDGKCKEYNVQSLYYRAKDRGIH